MNPITIQVIGTTTQTPDEICTQFLDTQRWTDFKGYGVLPGIRRAQFMLKTPELVGSRIRVENTDGSSHFEEIIAWDSSVGFALQFDGFTPPLKFLASHFIEHWAFRPVPQGTEIHRTMAMYPKNWLGWLVLLPISRLMRKAFEQQATQTEM